MAKKTVASLQTSSRDYQKPSNGEISKTGAYTFVKSLPELVDEFLKKIIHYSSIEKLLSLE
jgi:hypothetical protein